MTFEQLRQSALAEWAILKDRQQPRSEIRIALRNHGLIEPGNISQYIALGGYSGLQKALKLTPAEVIEEVNQAGLRGRGGAGFPTAAKWRMCQAAEAGEKYVICNAADGDQAAPVGRLLLESDPHSVLEGMLIAAYAVGATQGYIYINPASGLAIERLQTALKQLAENNILGNNILDSSFSFHIEIKAEASDLLSGEETAILRALEGKVLMPGLRPPFPAVAGFNNKPTLVNNVETLTHIAAIFQKGADWYAGIGSKESKGTKLLYLSGKVVNVGIAEVPMGTTLRQIINDIGGGVNGGKELKAVFIGGPAGGCLPESVLDIPLDFATLAAEGCIMGSGQIVVADQDNCIVDLVRECLALTKAASCGKCVLCREGTAQMLEILTDISAGKGRPEDVDLLIELGEGIKAGSLCAYGKTVPNPVLTTIKHFREEYDAHIKRKRCPAMVCKKYISYHILGDKCQGCQVCIHECSEGAIAGGEGLIHVIDQDKCTKCGKCLEACPVEYSAVTKAGAVKPKTPDEPIPVGTWKKKR
jgi:NADH-quinone oxidoreductase subunit F